MIIIFDPFFYIWKNINYIKPSQKEKEKITEPKYHHEYERIQTYLDTTVVDPVEAGRLEQRKNDIKAMGVRQKTKYDELLNGNNINF